jgi:hypothetical protein
MNRNIFKKTQQYEKLSEENTKDVIIAANNGFSIDSDPLSSKGGIYPLKDKTEGKELLTMTPED